VFHYNDVVTDVRAYLAERIRLAQEAGVAADRIVIDPGIEFGKLVNQDLEVLRRLDELHTLQLPVLVAISRKYFIGHVLGELPPEDRLEGTAAGIAFAITRGAHIIRVHDVKEMVQVTRVTEALLGLTHTTSRIRSDGVSAPD
jgi:dihydropteroate synthase